MRKKIKILGTCNGYEDNLMQIKSIKTGEIKAGDSIKKILDEYLPQVEEKSIVAITSKIVSLCENRVVKMDGSVDKYDLVKEEAELILDEGTNPYGIYLTIKEGLLLPTAGIDESNGNGFYILYPKNPMESCRQIWEYLKERDGVKNFGIIITDSRTSPLRRGVTGVSISWCGLRPIYDYVGKPDIFGRKLAVTATNNIDALAASAVFVMGEGSERTPIAIIKQAPRIEFTEKAPTKEEIDSVKISLEDDIFAPLLRVVKLSG